MARNRLFAYALMVVGSAGVSREGFAQDCWPAGMRPENALVVSGSTAVNPMFKQAAKNGVLATMGGIDIYAVGGGSCGGSDSFLQQADLGSKMATHWMPDATGTPVTCTMPAGVKSDFGVSDVFYTSCSANGTALPAGFSDTLGPVQPMVFVVPAASPQKGLVAEEGYFVFGFGAAAGKTVSPWTDLTSIIIRDQTSGTQQMTARAVGLPNGQNNVMKGTTPTPNSSDGVVMALKAKAGMGATVAESTIGILGADIYDNNRTDLKALFFQSFKQQHGYLPDSTETSFDKRNVRSGKYAIWGPSHFFAAVDGAGKITNPKVQSLFDYISLTKTKVGTTNVVDFIVDASYIPQCAMKVKRTSELGPMSAATIDPVAACGCYMEERKAAGSSKCTKCTGDGECTGGKKCSMYGYCE